MYDLSTRRSVLALVDQGRSINSVSAETGISRAAIRSWRREIHPARATVPCPRCASPPRPPADPAAYCYLLGLYLGDGCVSRLGRTYSLRIACAEAWPGLVDACEQAVLAVRGANRVSRVRQQGCVAVTAYSNHWPCLFPQHGKGKKHERRIVLAGWQRRVVDAHPWELVRGLVHSDGCRVVNRTSRIVGGERKRYAYPRYFLTNRSEDILRLYADTLTAVGVEWKVTRRAGVPYNVSVARRGSVALMDAYVGPKH
ncbi:helix-turn-helix domain-containing protein [Streptomyces sp. NPDC054784]